MKDRFAVSMFGQKRLSREGGIEIVVKELCTRMARDGCQVTCYNRSGHHVSGAEYDNKIEYDGIRQKFVPTNETKVLASEGIKVNVTLIFSANQALLAARAGAAYVSPFLGRLDDISQPGIDLIDTVAEIFALHDIETEIIAASVRHTMHVTECALAGADIATVPYKVIEQMTHHPLTDQGIEKFRKDYEAVFGK